MENFLVIDVEAGLVNVKPYNLGLVISNGNEVLESHNIFMTNHIRENFGAMYMEENLNYFKNNRNEFECYNNDEWFSYDLLQLVYKYELKKLFAYNVRFDYEKLEKLVGKQKINQIFKPHDIMTAA